jgi:hypothetical protein
MFHSKDSNTPTPKSELTLLWLANRSDGVVMAVTFIFALFGGFLAVYFGDSSHWGVWIPFCFFAVPPIHYLSRAVIQLQQKVELLEKRLSEEPSV